MSKKLGKTIDEVCNQPAGTFQKHLKEEEERLKKEDAARKERIKARKNK